MYLEELIGNVQLENDKFKCKSRLNREDVVRRDGFTNGATYEEIIEMSVKSKNTQYDILGIWRGNPRRGYAKGKKEKEQFFPDNHYIIPNRRFPFLWACQ